MDFIDPKLLKKQNELQEELKQLKEKQKQIISNTKLSVSAKNKLLKFNDECIQDLLVLEGKWKDGMVDYFDQQVNVVTKKGVSTQEGEVESRENWGKNCDDVTKLTFDEERSYRESVTRDGNSTSFYIQRGTNRNFKDSDSYYTDEGFDDKTNTSMGLNTTGKLVLNNGRSRSKESKSFELITTVRNHKGKKNLISSDCYDLSDAKKEKNQKDGNGRSKASIFKVYKSRMQKKLAKKEFQLEMERIFNHNETYDHLSNETERNEDKQLIDLLYKKIELLEKNNKKMIEEEVRKVEERYEGELEKLREKYFKLSEIQEENKGLMMKRKELLKFCS